MRILVLLLLGLICTVEAGAFSRSRSRTEGTLRASPPPRTNSSSASVTALPAPPRAIPVADDEPASCSPSTLGAPRPLTPLVVDPFTRLLPHLSGPRELCQNGIDDDGNGLIDCADRAGCRDGSVGPSQEILATQCCAGRAALLSEFNTVKNCGACGSACIYPDGSKNPNLYLVGTCEKQEGSWTCVPPEDSPSRQRQLLNSACYSGETDPLSKALETIEKLEPKIKVGEQGTLSISVSQHCAQIHFRRRF